MKNNKIYFKLIMIILISILIVNLTGCASIRDKIANIRGDLIGKHFVISAFDNYANKILTVEGSKITVGLLENEANLDPEAAGYESSVLELTVNGKQMFQVGNTIIFSEDGLDMVEDFGMPTDVTVDSGGGFVPFDRLINELKNKIGKEKTIIISSQMGIPIGVYQGEEVFVTVPDNLPKMTRLNIDGKSLYIHRANYIILDTDMIN